MSDTANALLDTAQHLVQTRGYNAFSFRDLSRAHGMTNAGVHYHFPSKDDLGQALVARYRRVFAAELAAVRQAKATAPERLRGFVGIYAHVLRQERLCLCGMLASEAVTLPTAVRRELRGFFTETKQWLAEVLSEGEAAGTLAFEGAATDEAASLLASTQGAMLTAWPFYDPDQENGATAALSLFETITESLVQRLVA